MPVRRRHYPKHSFSLLSQLLFQSLLSIILRLLLVSPILITSLDSTPPQRISVTRLSLDSFVHTYETLDYRPVLDRRKRSLPEADDTDGESAISSTPVSLTFRSHNRTFHLRLRPLETATIGDGAPPIFADDHLIDVDGVLIANELRPQRFLYEGYLKGSDTLKLLRFSK